MQLEFVPDAARGWMLVRGNQLKPLVVQRAIGAKKAPRMELERMAQLLDLHPCVRYRLAGAVNHLHGPKLFPVLFDPRVRSRKRTEIARTVLQPRRHEDTKTHEEELICTHMSSSCFRDSS